jgi:signal transduction histidine kinase/CheY-like chemotaxis protein
MDERDYEGLLQFLYLIPFGVIKMQPDGTVDFINPVAVEMLQTAVPGISCENGWEALSHLDSTLQEAALLSGDHLGPISMDRRSTLSSDLNHPRYAAISVYRVNALCMMVILADNTKLVLEEQSAKAAVRTKREFLASISHEMRTPLNGVIGITDLLLDTQLDSEQRDQLNIIKSSGHSLLAVINDILDYSKMEAGKLRMDAIPFSLQDVLNNTLQTLAFSAQKKGLELNQIIASGLPDSLIGDPARVRQILINLAGNAIKFTQHGAVKIRVCQDFRRQSSIGLEFSVEDTGIGIPLEKQSVIFEAFTQADQSTSRQYGGTGLGLSICSRLVEMMSGRIWLESVVGKGSQFHFTAQFEVPRTGGRPESPEVPAPSIGVESGQPLQSPKASAGLRILLAEDNKVNRLIAVKLLEKRGHTVITASNGRQAIEAFVADSIDLVLMDINMPEMDGLQATEAIRRKEALSGIHVPIVALTASALDTHEEECLKAGMDGYLTKPILPKALDEVLSRARASREMKSVDT